MLVCGNAREVWRAIPVISEVTQVVLVDVVEILRACSAYRQVSVRAEGCWCGAPSQNVVNR